MRRLVALTALLAALGVAPSALAVGTVTRATSGANVRYSLTAGVGIVNVVTVTSTGGAVPSVTFTDTGETLNYAAGLEPTCDGAGTSTVTCSEAGINFQSVFLNDLDDRLTSSGPVPISVQGGDGADNLSGMNASADPLNGRFNADGGPGDDTLTSGSGNDGLDGGAGRDTVSSGPGDDYAGDGEGDGDQVDLGPGSDIAELNTDDGTGDVITGGPGIDMLDSGRGSSPPPTLALSLDLNASTFTLAGLGSHTLSGFEDAELSGHTTTVVTGTLGANDISTGEGADTVDPLGGADYLRLGPNTDRALTRDGWSDVVVCGAQQDSAEIDQLDVAIDCENVLTSTVRPAGADLAAPALTVGTPARLTRKALLRSGVRVRLGSAEPASVELRLLGTAKRRGGGIVPAKAGDLVLAETALPLAAGSRTARVRLPKRLRSWIPRRMRLRLVAVARDEFGNAQTTTKRIRIVAPKRRRSPR